MSIIRKVGKAFRGSVGSNKILKSIENQFVKHHENTIDQAPIFIIGLPRSGSTLLYQLMVNRFKLGYISNLASVFYKCPVFISSFAKTKIIKYHNFNLTSDYGLIRGVWAPSEAASVFENWFDNNEIQLERKLEFVRNSCLQLSNIYKAPLVFKNLSNNYRLHEINSAFPNALFVFIERNPAYIIQSILIAKQKNNISIDSLQMINNSYDIVDNVVESTMKTRQDIHSFFKENKVNKLIINYEELCNNTMSILDKISISFEQASGNALLIKRDLRFNIKTSNIKKLSEKEFSKIKNEINKYSNEIHI